MEKQIGEISLKAKYRSDLIPVMEMLVWKKEIQSPDWEAIVGKTEQNVLRAPDQYLDLSDLPTKEKLNSLIREIFADFLEEESIAG